MKMLYCTYNVSVAEEMKKTLSKLDIQNYQIFDNVIAKTERSNSRFNNPVWPGYNQVLMVLINNVKEFVLEINKYNSAEEDPNEQIIMYFWNIEKV